ncbi:MAG: carbohydrate-binding protein [Chitinispirillaceae bacterium]|nr:carbohydrate-binding protein [Chitinispirillaceae bacterium]
MMYNPDGWFVVSVGESSSDVIQGTGGMQSWTTETCSVSGATGKHDLYLKFTGGSGFLFNFNWWKFMPVTIGIVAMRESVVPMENQLHVVTGRTGVTTLQLDLSLVHRETKVTVQLFGMNGRLLATLFNGTVASEHLVLPVASRLGTGGYVVRVLSQGSTVFNKIITIE